MTNAAPQNRIIASAPEFQDEIISGPARGQSGIPRPQRRSHAWQYTSNDAS